MKKQQQRNGDEIFLAKKQRRNWFPEMQGTKILRGLMSQAKNVWRRIEKNRGKVKNVRGVTDDVKYITKVREQQNSTRRTTGGVIAALVGQCYIKVKIVTSE